MHVHMSCMDTEAAEWVAPELATAPASVTQTEATLPCSPNKAGDRLPSFIIHLAGSEECSPVTSQRAHVPGGLLHDDRALDACRVAALVTLMRLLSLLSASELH